MKNEIETRNKLGYTALMEAALLGDANKVSKLLEEGADPLEKETKFGVLTALGLVKRAISWGDNRDFSEVISILEKAESDGSMIERHRLKKEKEKKEKERVKKQVLDKEIHAIYGEITQFNGNDSAFEYCMCLQGASGILVEGVIFDIDRKLELFNFLGGLGWNLVSSTSLGKTTGASFSFNLHSTSRGGDGVISPLSVGFEYIFKRKIVDGKELKHTNKEMLELFSEF